MSMPDVLTNASYEKALRELSNRLNDTKNTDLAKAQEAEILKVKVDNLKKYEALKEESNKKLAQRDLIYTEKALQDKKAALDKETQDRLDAIDREYKAQVDAINKGGGSDASKAAQAAEAKAKMEAAKAEAAAAKKQNEKELDDKFKYGKKLKEKQDKEDRVATYKEIEAEAKQRGLKGKEAQEFIAAQTKELGIDANQAKKETQQANATETFAKSIKKLQSGLQDLAKKLDSTVEDIASAKSLIDTRLQGLTGAGSYWEKISDTIAGNIAISPFIKQADVVNKVKEYVNAGIAFDVEQRAFLATISEKIATTFDANDSTLRRLIRLQQQDSTAARLGMESAMNAFLNNMYANTEYLNNLSTSVRSSLEEAQSLMDTKEAVELEFQVQKWLGSMYSVGMSDNAVSSLATAIGQLASGEIDGITSGGTGNLLVMAANNSGLSLTEMLKNGLDASNTNILLQSVVNYLADIYSETKGSKVLQQQYANIFNLNASDLKAAANLANDNNKTIQAIANNNLTYATAYSQLLNMANTMYQRTSMGEMLTNTWENFQYTTAEGIAQSPVLYGIYKVAGLLDDVAGGIMLPDIKVLGSGVNLQTSVADLMRVGAMSGGILSGIAKMISAGSGGGFNAEKMLKAFGVNNLATVTRGNGTGLTTSGVTVSSSGFVGNSEEGAVYNKTMSDANDSKKSQMAEAKEDQDQDVTNKTIDEHIVRIYTLLQNVIDGTSSFTVVQQAGPGWTP